MRQALVNDFWVKNNFGDCDFKDKRLSKRLLVIANKMSVFPQGSIPQQMEKWSDTKACYNFFRNGKVTSKRIQSCHRKRVRELISEQLEDKVTLFLQDTSEVDYSSLEATKGLGYIGNHNNTGLLFHSCLAIKPNISNPKILGLANQQVWKRKNIALTKNESRTQRNRRDKESGIWLKNLKGIGSPPKGQVWVSIGDRANDIFEFFAESKELGWESVVRVSQDRLVELNGQKKLIMSHLRNLPSLGTRTISVRKQSDTVSRDIVLNICWEQVKIQPPKRIGKKMEPVLVSVIRCWNEEEEIEWILYSSIIVNNLEEAIEKINWYSKRWIIEEYHKCIKTGCRIESSQMEHGKSIEKLLSILGIIAILMLQLRNMARENPSTPACEIVDNSALVIICKRYSLPKEMSIGIFWRSVAQLGGFVGRKSDGEPGWQTLWKGWLRLLDMMWVHDAFSYT